MPTFARRSQPYTKTGRGSARTDVAIRQRGTCKNSPSCVSVEYRRAFNRREPAWQTGTAALKAATERSWPIDDTGGYSLIGGAGFRSPIVRFICEHFVSLVSVIAGSPEGAECSVA